MAVRRAAMVRFGPFIPRARGSDSIFVRAMVDALSRKAVTFCPAMSVQHAELASIAIYYDKIKTYPNSRRAYRHFIKVRPLSQQERLHVFRETTRQRPLIDSVQLFMLLVAGSIVWWYGGLGFANCNA